MPPVVLPRDEVQHKRFEHEWWYFFASLTDGEGARYHYTTALMRRGVAWVSYYRWWAAGSPSILRKSIHRGPAIASDTTVLIEPRDNWRVRLSAGTSTHRLGAVADLHFSDDASGAFLHSRAADGGIRHYGGRNEMAWYSWPRLHVVGALANRPGGAGRLQGVGWMEHQWGNTDFTQLSWRYVPILLDSGRTLIAFHYHHPDASDETVEVAELVDGEARPIPNATIDPMQPGGLDTRIRTPELDLSCRSSALGIVDLGLPGVPPFVEAPSIVYGPDDAIIGIAMTEYHPLGRNDR